NLTGETIVALGGLDLPAANDVENAMQYSAVQLFIQSARRSSPGFEVHDGDLRHIIRICRSVDGLPLGVVLAASWTDSLSVVEIADEITRSLDFLESELRDLPARHRSMRAVFDYSWALLGDNEREAYAKLAVFMGGFNRDAAQAVANASLRTLTTLQNKSLVRRHPDSGRYELHELVRQYAAERLSEYPDIQRTAMAAHAEFYSAFLVKHGDVYMQPGQELKTLQAIEDERDNIRAAWTYAIQTDRLDLLEKSMGVVAVFFEAKGLAQEGSDVFHEIADAINQRPNPDAVLVARARVYGAQMEVFLGDYAHATDDAKAALKVFEAQNLPMEMGKAYNVLAYIAMNQGHYDDALDALERSIRVIRGSGHKHANMLVKRGEATLAYVLFLQGEYGKSEALYRQLMTEAEAQQAYFAMYHYNNLGEVLHAQGRDDEARPLIQKALDAFVTIKNLRWQAVALVNLGLIEHSASRFAEAEAYFRRALPLYKEIGDRRGVGEALNRLGSTVYWYGKYQESINLHQQAYALFTELGNRKGAADALVLSSITQNAIGDYDGAKRNLDTAFELRGAMGNMAEIADVQQILAVNAMYRGSYDEALMYLDQAQDILSATEDPDPSNHIPYQMLRGIIFVEAGRYESATPMLEEAVRTLEAQRVYWALAQGMASLTVAYINTGRVDEALEVGRRAVEYGYLSEARDWSMLAIIATAWAIALRGNPLNGVEYISYALNAAVNQHKFILKHGEQILAVIRKLLAQPEYEAAIGRGKNLRYEEVVSAIIGRPVEVNT
nr:tetratricopeptide repeat protein [Anaerolineae bacterium]